MISVDCKPWGFSGYNKKNNKTTNHIFRKSVETLAFMSDDRTVGKPQTLEDTSEWLTKSDMVNANLNI